MLDRRPGPMSQASFFLLAPRRTGTSTWLRACFPETVVLDPVNDALFGAPSAQPGNLARFEPPRHRDWIVVGEVQTAPTLREEVMQEALVRRVGAFTRFRLATSFSHAAILI